MSARFKGPFKKSSFNIGMRMLERLIIKPSLKLGSSAIKGLSSSKAIQTSKRLSSNYSPHNTSHTTRTSNYSTVPQDRSNCELEECEQLCAIIEKLSLDDRLNLDIKEAITKFHVAVKTYREKKNCSGTDQSSFTDYYCSEQEDSYLKTEKTRWEYEVGLRILIATTVGNSYEGLILYLLRSVR